MKKKLVLVLDVELDKNVDLQNLANTFAQAIQTVDQVDLHNAVLFDDDESSADKWVAELKKS
ncbi:hypothetical protein ACQCN2_09425 [Brevibacillus ginsengisoli]|uniref:hypothetical protein n=1 Tax=Brevibacillus ginsengisoli TaxID=363854 RepID=UPI003CEAEAAC